MWFVNGREERLLARVAGSAIGAVGLILPACAQDVRTLTDLSAFTSQPSPAIAGILPLLTSQSPVLPGSNSSTVNQTGSNNTAIVDVSQAFGNTSTQTQTGNANFSAMAGLGTSNTMTASQTGLNNTAGNNNVSAITALGSGNTLGTDQQGNNNTSVITAIGNGNTFSTTQIGTGLSYSIQRAGNGQSLSVTQIGTGR